MLRNQINPFGILCLDASGNARRKVVRADEDEPHLIIDVYSNAGQELYRMILGKLEETETSLNGGRFSNFDPKCAGHVVDFTARTGMEIIDLMALANQMSVDSNTHWGFSYEYHHMGSATLSLQVEDDASAVMLKMLI